MKRISILAVLMVVMLALAGQGLAQPGGAMHGSMGPAMMGGWGGGGMAGGQDGAWGCPMWSGTTGSAPDAITVDKAKELAQQYADQYLSGFTVERVLPFTGMRGTMCSVELKGPEGQVRTFHINPWGIVMPFGGPARRG